MLTEAQRIQIVVKFFDMLSPSILETAYQRAAALYKAEVLEEGEEDTAAEFDAVWVELKEVRL